MSTPGELLEALGREARARFGHAGHGDTRLYRGRSVEELVPQIQRELGADAIIVRRREGLTGGVFGFFQHPYVEIEAMRGAPGVDVYDEELEQMPPPPEPPTPAPQEEPPPAQPIASPPPAPAHAPPPRFTVQPPTPAAASAPSPAQEQAEETGSAYVTAHLAALARAGRASALPRQPVSGPVSALPSRPPLTAPTAVPSPFAVPSPLAAPSPFAAAIARAAAAPRAPTRVRAAAAPPPSERREVAPGSQGRARAGVARSLERCGIGVELAQELIDAASAHALALAPRAGLAHAVRVTLAQRIPVAPPLPAKGAAIVLVGAGGTGKTTCCAALLGAYRRGSSLPASFATITRGLERSESGRRGAPAKRGELMAILSPTILKPTPARSPRAMRALRKAQDEGVTIIDTPNVSPADRAGIRELAGLLSELEPERVVVALPATLGATAAAQLMQALRPLGANSLVVTHADETDQLGVAVEAACRFDLAPEYMLERAGDGGWRLRQLDPTALAEKLLP